jgi:hypothetical protein
MDKADSENMTLFYANLQDNYLGYAAIFTCVGLGFLFLKRIDRGDVGPGYWALGFFLNSLGFLLWSGAIPMRPALYFLVGDLFHLGGFVLLVCGAYRFTGNSFKPWNLMALAGLAASWLAAVSLYRLNAFLSSFVLKAIRSALFISAGAMILRKTPRGSLQGRKLAGWSLIAWGLYVVSFAFLRLDSVLNLAFGLMVGFQVLAAFGMVGMVIDRMRTRAEESDQRVQSLEGLLPICAYCKKIRDKGGAWHTIESYIEDHSTAEFSHGICPECFRNHKPDA